MRLLTDDDAVSSAVFHLETPRELDELLFLLNRAVNTLPPHEWPAWLPEWFERLERMR